VGERFDVLRDDLDVWIDEREDYIARGLLLAFRTPR
jgi:hypothetical protein